MILLPPRPAWEKDPQESRIGPRFRASSATLWLRRSPATLAPFACAARPWRPQQGLQEGPYDSGERLPCWGRSRHPSAMSSASSANVVLVIGHGREASLTHHLLEVAREELTRLGATCRIHDLLADGFDPVLRLAPGEAHAGGVSPEDDALVHRYQSDVRWADAFVILHPVWWFAPPAILKGWIDRVMAEGVALDHATEPPRGLLGGRRAILVQTFKAGRAVDSVITRGVTGAVWRHAILAPLGVRLVHRLALHGVGKMDEARLATFEARLRRAVGDVVP